MTQVNTTSDTNDGATAVITANVREGYVQDYENWLNEIQPICRSYPGFLDSQVIRPIAGLTRTFTFVIRFDTIANLRNWLESKDRKRLIEKARLLMSHDDNYKIQSGLEFWFTPPTNDVKVPARWKQCLLTWSAIYPLVLLVPLAVNPVMRLVGVSGTGKVSILAGTIVICGLMTYVVMPHYTKLMKRWLYGERD
ncbi:MAG: antibiotic biosynthesis monooxygenase [Verrucomicrobiales bacterium]|nr:antibiotic biosynthesis monooxygenase [Verrucomicrobiales bacterium]